MNRFWIVLGDKHTLTATVRHTTRESAVFEAKRLASENHGQGFFVAAVTGLAKVEPFPTSWTELKSPGNCFYGD